LKEVQRLKVSASDFEVKNVIGRGHFGEVQVVRDRHTETVYAMKTLRKQETLAQSEVIKSL
jgi:citron Rho-interacting kinase